MVGGGGGAGNNRKKATGKNKECHLHLSLGHAPPFPIRDVKKRRKKKEILEFASFIGDQDSLSENWQSKRKRIQINRPFYK